MKTTPYSFRFSADDAAQFAAFCERNGITMPTDAADVKAVIMQAITTKQENPTAAPVEESEVYLTLQADYSALQEKYADIEQRNVNLYSSASKDSETLQQKDARIAELEAQVQALAAQDENTVTIAFLPNVKKLLNVVCLRLSKKFAHKYPDGITPALLLADMFLRYNRDQNNEWFHPFVVSARDAKKVLKGEEISEEE